MKANYPASGHLSVWIGTFDTEDQFDHEVDRQVDANLRLPTSLAAICEVAFEEAEVPIDRLLEGFSGWESFSPSAVSVAVERGIPSANAALVVYHTEVKGGPEQWGRLKFLGTFRGTDVE